MERADAQRTGRELVLLELEREHAGAAGAQRRNNEVSERRISAGNKKALRAASAARWARPTASRAWRAAEEGGARCRPGSRGAPRRVPPSIGGARQLE